MKFSQWRAALEVLRQDLNVTESAKRLFVSQSVISKQIRALEYELGVQIFERSGKRFVGTTRAGKKLLTMAATMLENAQNIERAAREFSGDSGSIRLAATNFSLSTFLPEKIARFKKEYPQTEILIEQARSEQIAAQVVSGEVDFGILVSTHVQENALVALPFAEFSFVLIAHPQWTHLKSFNQQAFKLENLNQMPLILPNISADVRLKIEQVFQYYQIKPKVVLNALDMDCMKIWAWNQFGVAILPENALNKEDQNKFYILNVASFFPKIQARVLIRRGAFLRRTDYELIGLFASHFTMDVIDSALNGSAQDCFL